MFFFIGDGDDEDNDDEDDEDDTYDQDFTLGMSPLQSKGVESEELPASAGVKLLCFFIGDGEDGFFGDDDDDDTYDQDFTLGTFPQQSKGVESEKLPASSGLEEHGGYESFGAFAKEVAEGQVSSEPVRNTNAQILGTPESMIWCPMLLSICSRPVDHVDSMGSVPVRVDEDVFESAGDDSTLMSDSASLFLDCDDSGFVDVGLFLTAMTILEVAIRAASRDEFSSLALLRMWMQSFKFLSKSPYSVPMDTLVFITAATLRVVAGMFTGSPLLSTIVRDFGALGTSQPYAARLHRNSIGLLVKFSQERKSSLSLPCPEAEFFELYHKVLGYVTIPPEATESNVEHRTRTSKNHYASSSSQELAETSSFALDQIDYSLNSAVVTTTSASQRRGKRSRRCRTPSCVAMQAP